MINYKNILLSLAMLPMAGFAQEGEINAFRDGSVWVEEAFVCDAFGDEYICYNIYSLSGECTVNGIQCLQMWLELKDNPINDDIKIPYGYVYREGEKIWYISEQADNPTCLLYDFGIEAGDVVTGLGCPSLTYPGIWQMDSKLQCDGISTQNYLGHECTVFDMSEPNYPYGKGQWIKGIGDTRGVFTNCQYSVVGDFGTKLVEVIIGGEVVYGSSVLSLDSLNNAEAAPAHGSKAFIDGRFIISKGSHQYNAFGLEVK